MDRRTQLLLGIAVARRGRAPRWAAEFLNLLIAEPAIRVEALYELHGVRPAGAGWFHRLFGSKREGPLTLVRIHVKPACCFIELECTARGLTDEGAATVRGRNLDVLLWCDEGRIQIPESVARHGSWQVAFDQATCRIVSDEREELNKIRVESADGLCDAAARLVVDTLLARAAAKRFED